MKSKTGSNIELPGIAGPPQRSTLERFVQEYARRSRHRRVDDREFERSVCGYARARAIAYSEREQLAAADLARLRAMFRELRRESVSARSRAA